MISSLGTWCWRTSIINHIFFKIWEIYKYWTLQLNKFISLFNIKNKVTTTILIWTRSLTLPENHPSLSAVEINEHSLRQEWRRFGSTAHVHNLCHIHSWYSYSLSTDRVRVRVSIRVSVVQIVSFKIGVGWRLGLHNYMLSTLTMECVLNMPGDYVRARKINVLVLIRKKRKMMRASNLFYFLFFFKLKNKCLGSHQKKLKNDEVELKYHIARKCMHFTSCPRLNIWWGALLFFFW